MHLSDHPCPTGKTKPCLQNLLRYGFPALLFSLMPSLGFTANLAPAAHAGADQTVGLGINVALNGSESTDGDGFIKKFRWRQIKGKKVVLLDKTTPIPQFISPSQLPSKLSANQLIFKLTVTGDHNKKSSDTVTANLNLCPPPQYLIGGVCQSPQPICIPPNVIKKGICVM